MPTSENTQPTATTLPTQSTATPVIVITIPTVTAVVEVPEGIPPTPISTSTSFSSRFPSSWYWTDVNGHRVSGEIIYSFQGSDHCGWETAAFLHIGSPLGASMEPRRIVNEYVKDPDGVLSRYGARPAVGFVANAELPGDAEFSGYVKNGVELWISQEQLDLEVYMVDGSLVEKWPRANPIFGCA